MHHLRNAAKTIEECLDELGAVASARRRGEQLVALAVGAHSASLERLIALAEPGTLEGDDEIAAVLWAHRPTPPEEHLLDAFEERLDRVLDAIAQTGVPGQSESAAMLLQAVSEIYGGALARAVEVLHLGGQQDVIRTALHDDLIASALVAHGLHPDDVEIRARTALTRVDATFADGGPRVVFVGLEEDGTIRLRAQGEPVRDRWRVALAAERAVAAATPDAPGVIVDGAEGHTTSEPSEVFIPLSSIGRHRSGRPKRWVDVPELADIIPGQLVRLAHDDLRLLACRVGTDLYVALDPFNGERLRLHLSPDGPPAVSSSGGTTFLFDDPLPVQHDGDLIEVAVP